MAKKKKADKIDDYLMHRMPAQDAARAAVQAHPDVCELQSKLENALASTIRRVLSHRPLVKKHRRRK